MFVLASQIFSLLLATIVVAKSYVDFRARIESGQVFAFWVVTWSGIVAIALFPSIIDRIILAFGAERAGLGTFFGMAIVFLFFVVYRLYSKVERLEKKLSETVREIALREVVIPENWSKRP